MKTLNSMTTYELFIYSTLDQWNVQYIQFDEKTKWHNVGELTKMMDLYREWNENAQRKNSIFTALIKWFEINPTTMTITICLDGYDGRLHYE